MTRSPNQLHVLIALALGAVMPFTFSPYDFAWLAIPVLIGWLWLICQGSAFRMGYAFGFGWFGFGAWWLAPTLHTFGHLPWVMAAFCVMLVGAVMALLPALWAWLTVKSAGNTRWVLVSFPLAAVASEWLRGHIFTGLPWTALGNLMLDTPAIGWASWFGVYGMALLPALIAAALLLLLTHEAKKWGSLGLVLATALVVLAPQPNTGEGPVYQAALVQANIPQDKKWDSAFLNETMFRYAGLSDNVAQTSDIIIWPEAAVPFFLSRSPRWNAWLGDQITSWETPLLFGGLKLTGDSTANNGLFAHDPLQAERQFAGKQHLVPFGEYVPSWIPFLHALVPEIADFRPAEDTGVVEARGIQYGALICYESLFPEQARFRVENGAQVLVNVTNDAWYGTTPAAWQHFQAARMRAVETGRYVLRAANTGVSAVISPDGKVLASLPWWTKAALQGEFQLSDARTPFVRWGDGPLLITLLLLFIPLVRGRRKDD
ncbi:apolipoprotein N-acyltransferase [Mariprofundus micogutta]|uniref:Apolipoprotein N-acyltransferase n=1 Tax=Mariprofundus micogutta TaxID=1921010 RepID=A0A1L8CMB9_9PROT|nr:apolipoprotein N-acyltransferase [Mariprofundus micogutta]GAV20052.1 apolipoprotein N-acyltransferase [Mariprofundus micogutta]